MSLPQMGAAASSREGAGRGNGGLGWSLTKGAEVSPEVVGLSSNPLTTSCVRHCAKGEGGAKRERRLRGTEGGWLKDKGIGVSRGPMPYRCQLQPPPTWNLGFLLQPAPPRCLVPICQPGSSELQAQGGTARPPSCQAAAYIYLCPPMVAPLQRRWTLVASQASWQGHLVPQPWHSPGVWASRAEDGWLGGSPGTHG